MTQEELINVFKYIIKKCDMLINNGNYEADDYAQDTVEDIAELCNHILDGDYGKLVEVKEKTNDTNSLKNKWVSCKNDLPKRKGVYLVITDGSHNERYDMARYDKEGWHKASKILYWMPVPLKRGIPNKVLWQ